MLRSVLSTAYAILVALAALAAVYVAYLQGLVTTPLLVGVALLSVLAQLPVVLLPGRTAYAPLYGVTAAALLLLGGPGAVLATVPAALLRLAYPSRPWPHRVYAAGATVLATAAAAYAYAAAGGPVPATDLAPSLAPFALATAAYFLAGAALAAIRGAFWYGGRAPRRLPVAALRLLPYFLLVAALGAGIAFAYTVAGAAAALLPAVLLVLPWYLLRIEARQEAQLHQHRRALRGTSSELAEANQRLERRVAELREAQNQLNALNQQLTQTNALLQRRIGELRTLHSIGLRLSGQTELRETLDQVMEEVTKLTGADLAAIFLFDPAQHALQIAAHRGLNETFLAEPELLLGNAALRAISERRSLVSDGSTRVALGNLAARSGVVAAVCWPLATEGTIVGALDIGFRSRHRFEEEELQTIATLAELSAVAISNAQLTRRVHEGYIATIHALNATLEAKDAYTRGHSEEVRRLSMAIGTELQLHSRHLELLEMAALFHDIGKIGIPEEILLKPDRLTDEEFEIMKLHPVIGQEILSHLPAMAKVMVIVRHHHERYDGKGYPDGISASEDMPIEDYLAYIVATADAYQSMTSDRPYRKSPGHEFAVGQLTKFKGSQFMPEAVDALLRYLARQAEESARALPMA